MGGIVKRLEGQSFRFNQVCKEPDNGLKEPARRVNIYNLNRLGQTR